MEFRVLGTLEVVDGARPVPINGAKQRALLTILLLHANQTVSSSRLLEELWGDEQPESGLTALQVRVSQLRKALGKGGESIVTKGAGYALELGANEIDLHRFEELVADADRALQREAPDQAWAQLQRALALWHGPPLADFAYESFASAAIARLEELRLAAQELRIDTGLRLGRHAELVAELEALIAEHPLREGLRRQHMLALYRSGRQAEALEAYHAARRTLVDELGIAPSPMLQELEGAILRQDGSLDLAPTRARQRSILAGAVGGQPLAQLLVVATALARDPARELIVARLIATREELGNAAAAVAVECERLLADGVVARPAVFTSRSPGADLARLATEQDADLVLVSSNDGALDDPELAELLRSAPCDVAVAVGDAIAAPGPVLVPFAGGEHDWSAIELGAWLAGSWRMPLRLAGPAPEDAKDASRTLASASLAVQRALGVAAEPLLVEPGPERLVAAAREAAVSVVGLPEGWRTGGLGPARAALAASGRPTLLVRKGLRPGGLAPPENLTRFTWTFRAG
jgi:DNA-binding SARP family transcriptional activator